MGEYSFRVNWMSEEKSKITKMAWETKGVRSVKNAITIKRSN